MIGTEIIHCDFYMTSDGKHFDTREEAERHVKICNDPENNKPICAKKEWTAEDRYWGNDGGYPTRYMRDSWYGD